MKLTKRQRDVHRALVRTGASNKEIALQLGIAVPTVKEHLRAIYSRLGCGSRVQAALAPLE
jgi:DNA-binding NarL/FixJ family response regulator